jgi:hypothetical protein
MAQERIIEKPKKKKVRKGREEEVDSRLSDEKRRKLKKLDEFIEGVLQEAGEEFIDEFKQVDGE